MLFLVVGFFFLLLFHHFKYIFWAAKHLLKSTDYFMEVSLHVMWCFPLAAFNILSLSYFSFHFSYNISWFNLWVDPVWTSLWFLDLDFYFLFQVRDIFSCNVFKYVLCPFLSFEVAIFISDNIVFKAKSLTRDERGHYMMIRWSL